MLANLKHKLSVLLFGVSLFGVFSNHAAAQLSCGSNIPVSSPANSTVQYYFAGTAGQVVTFAANVDSLNSLTSATLVVLDPSGNTLASFPDSVPPKVYPLQTAPVTLPSSSYYYSVQVRLAGGSGPMNFNLSMQCINPPQRATPLSCGSTASGNLTTAAQVDEYTISGTAGDVYVLNLASTNYSLPNPLNWLVYGPTGNLVTIFTGPHWGKAQVSTLTIPATGTYVIQVGAYDLFDTGTYWLGLSCVHPLASAKPLSCGSVVNGTLASLGQIDQYAYAGQAGGSVSFQISSDNYPTAGFQLYDPAGKQVYFSGPLAWTGTYLIEIYEQQDDFGSGSYTLTTTCNNTSGDGFVPVPPCRVADTRIGSGFSGSFGPPSIAAGTSRSFPVQSSACGIPSTAQAYSLNVTAVPPAPLEYISIWPTGELQPLVSTLNSLNGQVVANAAIVPGGSSGAVSVYSSDNTDVVIDINGYFAGQSSVVDAFYTDTPCRIADTRVGSGFSAPFGQPSLIAGDTRAFPIFSSTCGIPVTASAYSLNMTVVPPGPLTYLSVWPEGESQPVVSTLNSFNGRVVANAALVPAGSPNGGVDVFASNNTDLIIDENGYFGPPGGLNGLHFYPVSPCRIADTRASGGFTGAFGPPSMTGGQTRSFPVPSSTCGIPSTAQAYSLNMTVLPSSEPFNYLTTWPTGQPQPLVSTLNSYDGSIAANAALVPAGTGGAINVYVSNNTDLLIDIDGYFAP